LKNFKGKHFIFASSGSVENLDSIYALTKKLAEEIIIQYCTQNQIEYTIFRFYNVIGSDFGIEPTNPDGLFYALSQASERGYIEIYGKDYDTPDGTAIRDYIHVMEVAHAIKRATLKASNGIESLGHGVGYSVLEVVETFKRVNGENFKIKYKEKRKGDTQKSVLENVSSYMESLYSLEEMLKLR
jgi:UDP-glucose 4-epimerase